MECQYRNCTNTFNDRSNKQYCCRSCKQKSKKIRDGKIRHNNEVNLKILTRPYLKYRKDHCEHCSFIPMHICQLDVDHIDGNRYNNDESNLQTLCANCHRLKTYLNRDNHKKYKSNGNNNK